MAQRKTKLPNPELYRKAYLEWYPQWSEAKARAQVERVQGMSSAQLFAEYASLLAFGREINAREHPYMKAQRLRAWEDYYARLQTFEAKRRATRRNTRRPTARRNRSS